MKKLGLCVPLLMIASGALAEDLYPNQRVISMLMRYDLDSTSELWCSSLGKAGAETGGTAYAPDYDGAKRIKTDGSDTVTVSKDSGASAFANVVAGDIIATLDSQGRRLERVVVTKTSDDSIVVNEAWALSAGGVPFTFRHTICGDTGDAGDFSTLGLGGFHVSVQVRQLNVASGGVEFHVRCREAYGKDYEEITKPGIITTAGTCYDCGIKRYFSFPQETPYSCRVGLRLSGADDATDTGGAAEQIEMIVSGRKATN